MSDEIYVRFDYERCFRAIQEMIEGALEGCAEKLIEIMKNEIMRIGNGDSQIMRPDAARQVKEILREVTDSEIKIGVGIDPEKITGMSEAVYVRTMVVVFGNQTNGKLYTKPGQVTYKKYVMNKGPSSALETYALPDSFNQFDKHKYIERNSLKQVEKHVGDMVRTINSWLDEPFFEQFIVVR